MDGNGRQMLGDITIGCLGLSWISFRCCLPAAASSDPC